MNGDACILRSARQQGIPDGNQFRSVAAREQTLQEQQRLMLSSAIVPSEVDNAEGARSGLARTRPGTVR